jgi:hypothetical protein
LPIEEHAHLTRVLSRKLNTIPHDVLWLLLITTERQIYYVGKCHMGLCKEAVPWGSSVLATGMWVKLQTPGFLLSLVECVWLQFAWYVFSVEQRIFVCNTLTKNVSRVQVSDTVWLGWCSQRFEGT